MASFPDFVNESEIGEYTKVIICCKKYCFVLILAVVSDLEGEGTGY